MVIRIDVVFDVPVSSPYHQPTVDAVRHAAEALDAELDLRVVRTPAIDDHYLADLPDGVVIGPGTPYLDADRAETVIRSARERGVPLVGT